MAAFSPTEAVYYGGVEYPGNNAVFVDEGNSNHFYHVQFTGDPFFFASNTQDYTITRLTNVRI